MIISKKIIMERGISRLLAITDLLFLIPLLMMELDSRSRLMVYCMSIRVFFYMVAQVFSRVRHSDRFYVAVFYEMDDQSYWRLVMLVMFAIKSLFLRGYIDMSPIYHYINFSITTFFLVIILMGYQSKPWVNDSTKLRRGRLHYLKTKAKLSDTELIAITPILTHTAEKNLRAPWAWRVTLFLVSIIIGATLNSYATNIVDFIQSLGLPFKNMLPPF